MKTGQRAALDAATEQAIDWMVDLRSGVFTPRQQVDLDRWLAADPQHRAAWLKLGGALRQTFEGVTPDNAGTETSGRRPGQLIQHTLETAARHGTRRRRFMGGALAVAGTGLGAGLMAQQAGLWPDLAADVHTAVGERRVVDLPEGNRLLLDARSSVDLAFSATERVVRLRSGQLIATLRPDARQPLALQGPHATAQVQGGRCLLRVEDGRTLVSPLMTSLMTPSTDPGPDPDAIVTATDDSWRRVSLPPGTAAWFGRDGMSRLDAADAALLASWSRGLLAARNWTLSELLRQLQPYRRGIIHISDAAAVLRVSGTFPLDDSDAALQALAETLPIQVRRYTGGWLVRIDVA